MITPHPPEVPPCPRGDAIFVDHQNRRVRSLWNAPQLARNPACFGESNLFDIRSWVTRSERF
jgi:hypothetical protein